MIAAMRMIVVAALVTSCAAPPTPTPTASALEVQSASEASAAASLANDGREIAETQCASCHAIGATGESPNPAAPRFRTLLSRYHADVLEQELIEGVRVAHPMPAFQFNPKGVDALIVYLQSIQQPPLAPTDPRAQRPRHVDE